MTAVGHEERFPRRRLRVRCGSYAVLRTSRPSPVSGLNRTFGSVATGPRAELSAAGEWSREDLARQDRCTGATHPLQSAQQFSLPLDRWILRIGGIALLLDNAKLALDQLKA